MHLSLNDNARSIQSYNSHQPLPRISIPCGVGSNLLRAIVGYLTFKEASFDNSRRDNDADTPFIVGGIESTGDPPCTVARIVCS
jgi:hypothetical protein